VAGLVTEEEAFRRVFAALAAYLAALKAEFGDLCD